MAESSDPFWTEDDSKHFLDLGEIYTPRRDEIEERILHLLPIRRDDPALLVELGVGGGWLAEAILERYPATRVLGLDPSATMLQTTGHRLERFPGRFELRQFQLEDPSWLLDLPRPIRAFVSSLVIHHIDGPAKRVLYRDLYACLDGPGALIVADLVAPRSEWERAYLADAWEMEVRRQSLDRTGSLEAYGQFLDDHWNLYRYPDPGDMPSTLPEHLAWLEEAGFTGVDVFWQRAGHAVYGGYRGAAASGA